ncbi:Zinc finger A20 and AN1 domain-containing stress-associated protein 10, partial [Mucuna pruriens]
MNDCVTALDRCYEKFVNDAMVALTNTTSINNKKKRCRICNKKVGLIQFECRCGDVFCERHRYPEEHACKVNFKEIGRQELILELVSSYTTRYDPDSRT